MMTRSNRMYARLVAFLSMIGGSAMIFGLIILMNAQNQPPEKEEKKAGTQMTVEKRKKPPKKKTVKRKVRRKIKTTARPHAPTPNLSASISGINFDLPAFNGAGLDDATQGVLGGDDTVRGMVMTEESVDVAPRPRERHAPAYPPRARAKGITGVVTLSLLIGADGRVERVKVLGAEPSGVFEETAISAVEKWYFEPAFYKGERVKVWARQVLRFNLS